MFPGKLSDSAIVLPKLENIRSDYGMSEIVLVGGSWTITGKAIENLRRVDGIGWISALKSSAIKNLEGTGLT
jgi:hypothetical protein